MKLRAEVRRFAERMERKLREHDEDRGDSWRKMSDEDIMDRIMEELREVQIATLIRDANGAAVSRDPEARADECADVANFLMFLSERRRK